MGGGYQAGREAIAEIARRIPWRRIGRWVGGVVASAAVLMSAGLLVLHITLPSVDHLADKHPRVTPYIEAWAGEVGVDAAGVLVGEWVPLPDIAPLLAVAVVESEDSGFRHHGGVEWSKTRKMARRYLAGRPAAGASTITQQLARNLFLDAGVTAERKLREILLALRMERRLSKERILELYLNVAEWGEGIWGIRPAARHYFGKEPGELDPFEVAFLPSLLPAPRRALDGSNLYRAMGVQRRVLYALYRAGHIDETAWITARRRQCLFEAAMLDGASIDQALRASIASR